MRKKRIGVTCRTVIFAEGALDCLILVFTLRIKQLEGELGRLLVFEVVVANAILYFLLLLLIQFPLSLLLQQIFLLHLSLAELLPQLALAAILLHFRLLFLLLNLSHLFLRFEFMQVVDVPVNFFPLILQRRHSSVDVAVQFWVEVLQVHRILPDVWVFDRLRPSFASKQTYLARVLLRRPIFSGRARLRLLGSVEVKVYLVLWVVVQLNWRIGNVVRWIAVIVILRGPRNPRFLKLLVDFLVVV